MLDVVDEQANAEGLALDRLNQLRPNRRLTHRTLNSKKRFEGKRTNYPHIRSKHMAIENETKADKFKRVACMRTTKTLRSIRLIGNLATANYSYTPEQVQKIETALYTAVEETMAGFNKATIKKAEFEL